MTGGPFADIDERSEAEPAPGASDACPADGASRPKVAREVLVVVWLWWVYDVINEHSPHRESAAIGAGRSILRIEGLVGIDIEHSVNRWVVAHRALAFASAGFYDMAHVGVTFAVLVGVWWWLPGSYRRLRSTLLVINVIGFVTFWTFPVAPPRLLPLGGFADVVARSGALGAWNSAEVGRHVNDFAAMPSLHVAWALWVASALWIASDRGWVRSIAACYVATTVVVVIGTGNHYVLDVLAGLATWAVASAVAARLARTRSSTDHPQGAHADEGPAANLIGRSASGGSACAS